MRKIKILLSVDEADLAIYTAVAAKMHMSRAAVIRHFLRMGIEQFMPALSPATSEETK